MTSRTAALPLLCLALLLAMTSTATCQHFHDWPVYRYTSGLPGGGWGVTPEGIPGFDGAIQMNVPVAYTPHRGAIIGYSWASLDSNIRFRTHGDMVTGQGWIALGIGESGRGLFVCEMPTAVTWEPIQNLQQQFMAEGAHQPAVAFGIVDIFENRDRYLNAPDRLHDTRSPYVVATKQFGDENAPVHVSLGWGTGRFNDSFFGGVSWRMHEEFTVMAEYDGFNPNAGVAFDLSNVLGGDTVGFVGLVDLERPTVGITYVYSGLNL